MNTKILGTVPCLIAWISTIHPLIQAQTVPCTQPAVGERAYLVGEWITIAPDDNFPLSFPDQTRQIWVDDASHYFDAHLIGPDSVSMELRFNVPVDFTISRGDYPYTRGCMIPEIPVSGTPLFATPARHGNRQTHSYLGGSAVEGSGRTFITRDGSAENFETRFSFTNEGVQPLTITGIVFPMEIPYATWHLSGLPTVPIEPGGSFEAVLTVDLHDRVFFEEFGSLSGLRLLALQTDSTATPLQNLGTNLHIFDTAADVPPEYFPASQQTSVEQWVLY